MDFIDIIDIYGVKDINRIAQYNRGCSMTYKELTDKSNALASYLVEKYGHDKTPIIIYGHKQNEMLYSFFACSKSGHPYIPVDVTFPYERVKDIIESSKAKLLLNIGELDFHNDNIEICNLKQVNSIIEEYSGRVPEKSYRVNDDDTYYILYTSGSTGKPKGVKITKGCIINFMNWFTKMCKVSKDDSVIMNQISYSFDVSVIPIYIGLSTGKTLYVIDKDMVSNFKELFENLKKSQIALWVSTPAFAEMCFADKSFNKSLMPKLEKMIFAGEVLTHKLVYKLYDNFGDISIINGYGPTEATVLVTAVELTRDMCSKVSEIPIGYCMDNCNIYFVDESGNKVKDGEKGELIICGDSVSTGYYNNEELSKKAFSTVCIDGKSKRAYKTGDLGYIKDGLIYYCGRKDFQIKLNGYRIELGDVENNLRKISFIENCIVLPNYKDGRPSQITAFITLNKFSEEKEFKVAMMVKDELKKYIPSYMVPRTIKVKDTFPMNTNGKIDRKSLMEELK